MSTVTFCGHGSLSVSEHSFLAEKLYYEIENLIKNGADKFLLGGYGSFDRLCAETVKKLKEIYPHITSILVIPYLNKKYNTDICDYTIYPPIEKTPPKFAISKRNEYMVEQSDFVIAYVTHSFGGAATTLDYARRKKKTILRITV